MKKNKQAKICVYCALPDQGSFRIRSRHLCRTLLFYLLLATLATSGIVSAASPVWKVERDGHEIYLGGSVHFLDQSQYPLPPGFDQAYSRSEVVVLETDLDKMQDPGFMAGAMARLSYPAPASIRERLETETERQLETYFAERGIPFEQVERFRPGLLMSTMLVIELQRLGLAGAGVDLFVQRRAAADGKPLLFLESVDEQLDILASMGGGEEDAAVRRSLADSRRLASFWKEMLAAWRVGDLDKLNQLTAKPMRRDLPRTFAALVTRRNIAWLERLDRLLADAPTEFVVVGALHLVGEGGLLDMLAARGCRVSRLP